MDKTKSTEELIMDCLQSLVRDAYYDALENRTGWFEMHSAEEIICAFEGGGGGTASDFLVCFVELAFKLCHEAATKGRAKREALNK